jgi:hypothetical protein
MHTVHTTINLIQIIDLRHNQTERTRMDISYPKTRSFPCQSSKAQITQYSIFLLFKEKKKKKEERGKSCHEIEIDNCSDGTIVILFSHTEI